MKKDEQVEILLSRLKVELNRKLTYIHLAVLRRGTMKALFTDLLSKSIIQTFQYLTIWTEFFFVKINNP
jgi:hypothetical protein